MDSNQLFKRLSITPVACHEQEKLGIALNVKEGVLPINGVRLHPQNGTCGWYIWAGEEMSEEPDFFVPLHVAHIDEWSPLIRPYLLLPPGWRFLVAPGYEDVWFDESVLSAASENED